ncbi:MAG TPA: hypothetical protein VKA46_21175 [Gemmataceae bacterium]|nr:hypothetical protein [Gemmataceae bacterium]
MAVSRQRFHAVAAEIALEVVSYLRVVVETALIQVSRQPARCFPLDLGEVKASARQVKGVPGPFLLVLGHFGGQFSKSRVVVEGEWRHHRKVGDSVRSKIDTAMVNEVLCKLLCYNLCCLIQEQEELGISPVFWKDGPAPAAQAPLCLPG